MQMRVHPRSADWASVDHLINIIDDIALGEMLITKKQQQAMPPALSNAMLRLIDSFQLRISAAAHITARDELTSVLSLQAFKRIAIERLSRADRCYSLMLIDLSSFKRVNDDRGYAAGDQLLMLAAARIISVFDGNHLKNGGHGASPLVGRIGGDEFAALIEINTIADAQRNARDVMNALREPFYVSQRGLLIGANIGMAVAPDHGCHYDPLLRHAELAISESKARGRNQLVIFSAKMAEQAHHLASLEISLREALIENQFVLYFQPQVRVDQSASVPIAEALIRWQHPDHGILLPGEFIKVAEDNGLICDLGRWVVAAAISAIIRFRNAGYPCKVAINICAQELTQHDFVSYIQEWLARTGANPAFLEIEITESAVMMADPTAFEHLNQLHAMGVGLSIDDFGTGYSNFARLANLPFDKLKIDRSLAFEVMDKPAQRDVVTCIVQLGKALGHEIVIEGVENEAQAMLFKAMGCNLLQGYHVSYPLPEAGLLHWLRDTAALFAHEAV